MEINFNKLLYIRKDYNTNMERTQSVMSDKEMPVMQDVIKELTRRVIIINFNSKMLRTFDSTRSWCRILLLSFCLTNWLLSFCKLLRRSIVTWGTFQGYFARILGWTVVGLDCLMTPLSTTFPILNVFFICNMHQNIKIRK